MRCAKKYANLTKTDSEIVSMSLPHITFDILMVKLTKSFKSVKWITNTRKNKNMHI